MALFKALAFTICLDKGYVVRSFGVAVLALFKALAFTICIEVCIVQRLYCQGFWGSIGTF